MDFAVQDISGYIKVVVFADNTTMELGLLDHQEAIDLADTLSSTADEVYDFVGENRC